MTVAAAQTTLGRRVVLQGVGVHSGEAVRLALGPADPDSGIVFERVDLGGQSEVRAVSASVASTAMCTALGQGEARVETVEHILAALSGCGVDNVVVEIDGPEVPILDGSARPFVEAIRQAGILRQSAPRSYIRVLAPVRVRSGEAYAEFLPAEARRFEVSIDYDCPVIGRQALALDLTPRTFRREVARARTFGHLRDVEHLWAAGLARGASLDNTVVVGDDRVLNFEGLRFPDEFARHKLLDAVGDTALAGSPILGLFRSHKGGHRLNDLAVRALLASPESWERVSFGDGLPRGEVRAGARAGLVAAAFAPERS